MCLAWSVALGALVSGSALAATPAGDVPGEFCERAPEVAVEAGFPGVATFAGTGIAAPAPAPECYGPSPCNDGRDNDGDSLVDYGPGQPGKDPGCDTASDREDPFNAPQPPPPNPGVPPPPPPPALLPLDLPLGPGQFRLVPGDEVYSVGVMSRWKTQKWEMSFDQLGISALNVVTMAGTFRVCYRPGGGGICGFSDVHGDAIDTTLPWTWKGTDPGYPYGLRTSLHTVEFHYRGTAAVCIFSRGCGPERHPWVTITFWDNNTMKVDAGVV